MFKRIKSFSTLALVLSGVGALAIVLYGVQSELLRQITGYTLTGSAVIRGLFK